MYESFQVTLRQRAIISHNVELFLQKCTNLTCDGVLHPDGGLVAAHTVDGQPSG